MDHKLPESAITIILQSGEWVLWNGRPHRFEGLNGERARIREATSQRLFDVSVAELRGLPSLTLEELDERVERQRVSDMDQWSHAERREDIIREAMNADGPWATRERAAAKALSLSTRHVRRLLARYRVSAQTTSLLSRPSGPRNVHRRLGAERERLVNVAIEKRYLVRPRTTMEETYREVLRRCRQKNLPAPARGSVIRRIRALDARLVARRRLGHKAAQAVALSTPGTLEATGALELVQVDHTLADVMIVDSTHRRSIGRPWLTLAIDVATRCVLGFHVALEAPSALNVALCIEHAVLPKKSSGRSDADIGWDAFGVPRTIHVDNGQEFHSEALRRGCSEYGIKLVHRPAARPRFGGHIERLIGTMMGRVHLLPGSTDSSPSRRAGYQAEKEARLTLLEFTQWLWLEIAGPYHHGVHRMLGTTPCAAWKQSLAEGVVPRLPADPARFMISFLPIKHRRLQRNGLFLEHIRYWSDVLPTIAQPRESLVVRFDPRNLSQLFVLDSHHRYHTIPYADIRRPPISLWELRHAHAILRRQAKASIDEERLFAVHERQVAIVKNAVQATKAARRRKESPRTAATSEPLSMRDIDFSKDPVPLPSEIWESSP
jgi:putative transposase